MAKGLGGMTTGQIKSEVNYKDGKKDGKRTWWFEDGQIKFRGKLQRRQARWQMDLSGIRMVR